jgi:hypothetical protein
VRLALSAVAALMMFVALAAAQKIVSPLPTAPLIVPSQPPPPSAREEIQSPDNKPSASQQPATDEQRGTERRPAVVKILPAEKTADERAQEQRDRKAKSSADWWIIRLTGALALVGILQFLALIGQGVVFAVQAIRLRDSIDLTRDIAGRQERDMQQLIGVARDNAAAATAQADAMAGLRAASEAQERVMREQADLTNKAALAAQASAAAANAHAVSAEDANKINRDLLIATQRPWISAKLNIAGDLQYRSDGAAVIPITCTLKNTGRTPAIFVWPHIRGVLQGPTGKNNAGLQRLFMTEIRQGGGISRQFGHTLFPEQEIPVESAIIIENGEIKTSQAEGVEREILQIVAIGFVEYQFTFQEQPRETGFIYIVLTEHPQSHIMTPTIFRDLGDIPRDKLDVKPWWVEGAGFFAT